MLTPALIAQTAGLPVWAQVLLTIVGLATAYIAFLRQRDANVWRHIGSLQAQMGKLEGEIKALRDEGHAKDKQLADAKILIITREIEVNDLLDEMGRPAKYVFEKQRIEQAA